MSGQSSYSSKRLIGTIILLLILVLLAPIGYFKMYGAPVGHHPVPYFTNLLSFTWNLSFSSTSEAWSVFFFQGYATQFLLQLPLRALFVFEGVRYSCGKSNLVRLTISGFLGDLLVILPMAIVYLSEWYYIITPLPLMTIIGVPLLWKLGANTRALSTEHVGGSSEEKVQEISNHEDNTVFFAPLLLFLLGILLPFLIISRIYPDWIFIGLESMIYYVELGPNGTYFSMQPLSLLYHFSHYYLYQIPRFLVSVVAYFHFSGRVSLKRTLFVSVILEILSGMPFIINGILAMLFLSITFLYIEIPLPMLSLCIFIISKARSKRANSQSIISQ